MGPANANAGRGEWFRTTLAKPATITTMVVGASIALLRGAHAGGFAGAAAAPAAAALVVLGVVWWLAERHAEMAFWDTSRARSASSRSTTRPRSRPRRRCSTRVTAGSGSTS
jgi:hypothetical protein